MMDSVILVNPNRMKPAVGPLGLDYLADFLKQEGFDPHIADLCFERSYRAPLAEKIRKLKPLAVGISVRNLDDCYFASQTFLLEPVRSLVKWIRKNTRAPVIVGGVGYSTAPSACLDYVGADFGIRGDGENAMTELLGCLREGKEPNHNMKGLVRPGKKPNPPNLVQLENSPIPGRTMVDNLRYYVQGGQGNIETKRGCPEKCIYCADPLAKGRKIRLRNPESVAAELEILEKKGIRTFHFCDCEFNLPRSHAEQVCAEILRKGLDKKIKFYVYASPIPFDYELARLMAAAGCMGIDFGADSASPDILENLGRRHTPEDIEKAVAACRKAGITVMLDLLLAGPGEDRNTMKKTVLEMKRLKPDRVGVSMGLRIFQGTKLADMVMSKGPMDRNPNVRGKADQNPGLLFPVYYFSEKLGRDPEEYLDKLIDGDPMFFFAKTKDLEQNYNYNRNMPLIREIRKGARGAYWDILRKMREGAA